MRVLVAYATKAGSTAEVAAEIGRVIGGEGDCAVDVRPVEQLEGIDGYDAVVVGSGIRAGRWLPEAMKFVESHRKALRRVPVALFAVCLTMREDTAENRSEVAAYLDPVCEVVQPVEVGLFAGVMDYDALPLLLRLMVKKMGAPEGDFRDWEAVRAWASQASARLGVKRPAVRPAITGR